ncbi:MAG: hypothetical protein LV480_07055 [Methylacidiphilales bacterium]|nr:hypothetical protein [Candidatus Methylacidiphilales bacterium]
MKEGMGMSAMKQLGILVAGLAVGTLGTFAYEHYLGEGEKLAQAESDLAGTSTDLAQLKESDAHLKSETDSESAQIQQLTSSNDDLKKQLDAAKSAAAAPAPPNPFANMADIIKTSAAQRHQEKLLLLNSRLHLTPEQEAAVKVAMDAEDKMGEEMMTKFGTGKFDPKDPKVQAEIMALSQGTKTVDQTLNEILTPDQKTAYQQMQAEQQSSSQQSTAVFQMSQLAPLLQLSDAQKDQVSNALYQFDANLSQRMKTNGTDPIANLEAEAKAKEDALAKILTPEQLATYHQQAQSQLDAQKAMLQKMMPAITAPAPQPAPSTPAVPPANP